MKQLVMRITAIFFMNLIALTSFAQSYFSNFNQPEQFKEIGRGKCEISNGVFKSRDSYGCFGYPEGKNYEIKFRARSPLNAEQVQIWAGFHAYNRSDRYIVGLKGGLSDDLFLARLGYMGTDEFLALRSLDFHPGPGKWYDFHIVVSDNRIQIYLNNEKQPRIDVVDKNMNLAPSGSVTLGGAWIETEFDDLSISSVPDGYLKDVPVNEYAVKVTSRQKEDKRRSERAAYNPVIVSELSPDRTIVDLNGGWLFMPEYQLEDKIKAVSPATTDNEWHIMNVPDFWNPIRIWLHGETFGQHAKGVSDNYYQQETSRCENYTFDYKKTKAAWYRQWIELPGEIKDKNLTLTFDAVSKVAEVYINGQLAGNHVGMFGEIKIDGTKYFKPGKNLVAVHVVRDFVKNIQDADKVIDVAVTVPVTNKMIKDIAHGFYQDEPAGIWQPVKLEISGLMKIEDVFIIPSLTGATFKVTVKNYTNKRHRFSLSTLIVDNQDKSRLFNENSLENISMNPGEERVLTYSINSLQPKLWTPNHPNLYDFTFTLSGEKTFSDEMVITSGFRTFESKNGFLELNGSRYWLRGGNHTPFALAPNNLALANTFYQIMKKGNIDITRTHTTPYNKLWIEAADHNGIGISHEGTWPWLMINATMPDEKVIQLWADEYISLLKKYRNHPSILFWTINNEMKFYDNEPDLEKAKYKMHIISDVVKRMREIDPTRPICFDSNYRRKENKFGKEFFNTVDDGDIDDIHSYINWYDHTVFKQFNGEFQRDNMNPERPLISQEMSTGYPNSETGHPTRFYTFVHQNPQVLVGNQAYEFGDPKYFLEAQSFITGELAEALRRSNDQASGILHFALLTWFRNVYDPQKIEPYPTYDVLSRALSQVLVSAEIWGRHFYSGTKLPIRICIANDLENGMDLPVSDLSWKILDEGKVIASGSQIIPTIRHYSRWWLEPEIILPAKLSSGRTDAKLVFTLNNNGKQIAENEYKIMIATKEWAESPVNGTKNITLVDSENIKESFDFLGIKYKSCRTVSEALKMKTDLFVFAGLDVTKNCTEEDLLHIRDIISKGGGVLMINGKEAAKSIYPEHITGWIIPTEGDIVNLEIPESPVFDALRWMDLRYFNNNKREVPAVCHASLKVNRSSKVEELTSQTKIHGYINGNMAERSEYVKNIRGTTIVKINDNGTLLLSTMSLEKAVTDPIAGRLLSNMVSSMLK